MAFKFFKNYLQTIFIARRKLKICRNFFVASGLLGWAKFCIMIIVKQKNYGKKK